MKNIIFRPNEVISPLRTSENMRVKMNKNNPMKWNKQLFLSVICVMLEGLLSGCNFMVMYYIFQSLWKQQMVMGKIMEITGSIAVIFLIRLIIYSFGYVQGQVG
ncbi:hypothetical protein CG709_15350, partial [Lachnotalea glycerini]